MELPPKKQCTKCKKHKPLYEFYLDKKKNRYHSRCKLCSGYATQEGRKRSKSRLKNQKKRNRTRDYLSKYGITQKDYNKYFKIQRGECAICHIHQKDLKQKLCVDHDHKTGKVRGLLCKKCNIGLGYFKDNRKLLKSAVDYL